MGFRTTGEYTNVAKAFARETGPGITTAKIGNTFFKFDKNTNRTLIVKGKDRVIKTFYLADDGIRSFKAAMQQHLKVLRAQG